jgi:hypothetical protein
VEAASTTRDKLRPTAERHSSKLQLWELAVLGKAKKWRTVFFPEGVIDALRPQ